MKINVETDKRVNVYGLWEGKQIILCKKQQKRTPIGGNDWVGLWPTMSGEDLMLRRERPSKNVDFILSYKGLEYLREIHYCHRKNKYMAKVEYIPIDGKQRRLWERLEEINEFVLWDIDDGPMRYFETSNQNYLAIYRVYEIDYEIKEADVRDSNGRLSSYHKKLNEDVSHIIANNLANAEPIMSDSEFNERRNKILEIANDYPPKRREYRPQYRHISERNITPTISYEDVEPESTPMEHKYCVYCGTKLYPDAKFCHSCGKLQPTIQ